MAKKIQLHIPEPCYENWEKMSASERGRFCASCQKEVIDFTGMSDQQLVQFFRKPSAGSICGRLNQDQLETDIRIPQKRIPWLKYFFRFTLPAFLVSMKATAQGQIRFSMSDTVLIKPQNVVSKSAMKNCENPKALTSVEIKGRVVDEAGTGIAYASVVVEGTITGTVCDSQGDFNLKTVQSVKQPVLLFSAVGYSHQAVPLKSGINKVNNLIVTLKPLPALGEVVIAPLNGIVGKIIPRKAESVTDSFFENKETVYNNIKTSERALVKVFPNPVLRSQTVKISLGQNNDKEVIYIKILSMDGKTMHEKTYAAAMGTRIFDMPTNPQWPAGVYSVIVMDAKRKIIGVSELLIY